MHGSLTWPPSLATLRKKDGPLDALPRAIIFAARRQGVKQGRNVSPATVTPRIRFLARSRDGTAHMSIRGTHRGKAYEIPANDAGAWRWVICTQDSKANVSLNSFPRPVFGTSGEAVEAAKA